MARRDLTAFAGATLLALLMGLLALPALAQQMAANATLTPRAGETARGTFAATQSGTTWTVTLRMTGLTANATHVNHIHTGSCEAEGGIVQPLADLRADAAGNEIGRASCRERV